MIHVIATITTKSGKRDEFIAAFKQLVPAVLAEKGCLIYGPAVDVPTDISAQGKINPNVMMVVEQWSNLDDLKAHLVAPHMQEFRAKHGHLVESTVLQILQQA